MSYYVSGGHDAEFLLTDSSGRQWRITFDEDRSPGCIKFEYTAHNVETGERHFINAFTYSHPTEAQLVMLADAGWPDAMSCFRLINQQFVDEFRSRNGLTDGVAA